MKPCHAEESVHPDRIFYAREPGTSPLDRWADATAATLARVYHSRTTPAAILPDRKSHHTRPPEMRVNRV